MHASETRIYYAILTGALLLVVLMAVAIITIFRYHQKKMAFQMQRIKAEINSLEKERKRIATDLHDDFGASLSAIKLHLQCLEPENEKNILLIEKSEYYIDEAMKKLKRISFNIMPQILHRSGLAEALKELIDMLIPAAGIKINYKCEVNPAKIETRVHIYRIVQEITNNIIRHSKATVINFSIEKITKKIQLHIQDNGIGFDKNLISKNSKGEGLQNIIARVELLNAKIYLDTEPNNGVDYLIEIPAE